MLVQERGFRVDHEGLQANDASLGDGILCGLGAGRPSLCDEILSNHKTEWMRVLRLRFGTPTQRNASERNYSTNLRTFIGFAHLFLVSLTGLLGLLHIASLSHIEFWFFLSLVAAALGFVRRTVGL